MAPKRRSWSPWRYSSSPTGKAFSRKISAFPPGSGLVVRLLGAGGGVRAGRGRPWASAHGDVQLFELVLVDGAGGVHHLVTGGLGLGEGHDLPDVGLVPEDHDQTVHPRRYAAVRRCAVAERRQHRAEAALGLLGRDADDREDLLLQVGAVDPDAPRC